MFWKSLLATLCGLFIFSVLVFIFLAALFGSQPEIKIAKNSVLHLKLDLPIIERSNDMPALPIGLLPGDGKVGIGLKELKDAIKQAKEDDKIQGIVIEPNFMYSGWATLKDLREVLADFKSSEKFILSYSEYYTESEYYLASVADRIYLPPEGIIEFNGFSAEQIFIKGTLEKLKVEPQVFKVGEFKSAVEPFVRESMSEASREQTRSFLGSLYETYLGDVSASRSISLAELSNIADSMWVRDAATALEYKLITDTAYYDQMRDGLMEKLELESKEDIKLISFKKYNKATSSTKSSRNRIAVIIADGEIVNGKGDASSIGSESLVKQLRKVREDDKVKAIVLRVNSPGGSALASDVIWREVTITAKEKPIIASMSDLAASGGYYIAMGCDTIVAAPNTITGSIGIFAIYFNVQGLLNDHLGITTDTVNTGPLANIFSFAKPMSEFEAKIFQQSIEDGYHTFVEKVAQSRGLSYAEVDAVASGRVWSGNEALGHDLVDVIGTLDDAITLAAEAADLEEDDYRLKYYPEKTQWQQLISQLTMDYEEEKLKEHLGQLYFPVQQIKRLEKYQEPQTRLPFDLVIH